MSARLYFDVHIPSAILEGLRRRGIDVLTSQEDGTREVEDDVLLQRAATLGRLLISQDADFLAIGQEWQGRGRLFPGIIYAAQMGISFGRIIDDLELIATCAEPEELANRVIHLPLR